MSAVLPAPRACRACQAPLVFIRMRETGAAMPCDAALVIARLDEVAGKAATSMALVTEEGILVIGRPVDAPAGREVRGRVSHFATCPSAASFRTRPAAPPTPGGA